VVLEANRKRTAATTNRTMPRMAKVDGEKVWDKNVNRPGANVIPCAMNDMIPAMMSIGFLNIWKKRIAQKSLFFYACNIL
jgi:hypothetical protein